MINIAGYPLCAKRLQFQRAQMSDPLMNEYWAAVCVATDLDDGKLHAFGGFDFGERSAENGKQLLARLEQFISAGLGEKSGKRGGPVSADEVSVRSLLGAYRVKVSKLNGLDDYWTAATTLWPSLREENPKLRDIQSLRSQITSIPKKSRSSSARANFAALPDNWKARGV